jgi:hypothetical protein
MTQEPEQARIGRYDDRPLGVAIPRDQLKVGDRVDVVVEAQLLGQPTGVFIPFRNVVYRGLNELRHQFEGAVEKYYFADHEIVRVALCTD